MNHNVLSFLNSKLRHSYCVVRHGQSLANVAKIISSDPSISIHQHGLSELGKEQAMNAGLTLQALLQKNNRRALLYSSDFKRARETAECILATLQNGSSSSSSSSNGKPLSLLYNNDLILESRLRERYFGRLNGGSDCRYEDVWELDLVNASHTEFDAESVHSVLSRTTNLINELEDSYSDENLCMILVAHGDVLQILQAAFQHMDGRHHRSLPHLETAVPRMLSFGREVENE